MGTGSSCSIFAAVEPRNSLRGWASLTGGDDRQFAGLPAEVLDRVFDAVAATDDGLGFCDPGQVLARLREHLVGVGGTGDSDDAGVDTRGQIDRHEREQPQFGAGGLGERGRLLEQRVGARPRADRRRDAGHADRGVDPTRAFGSEHDRHVRGVQKLGGDRAEPMPPAQAAVGRTDHDVRRAELLGGGQQPLGERVGEPHIRPGGDAVGNLRGGRLQPRPGQVAQVAVVARIGGSDHAAVVCGQDDDHLELGTGCRGQARTERDGILSRFGRRVADDDLSAHARAPSRICDATSRPMRIAPSTCW